MLKSARYIHIALLVAALVCPATPITVYAGTAPVFDSPTPPATHYTSRPEPQKPEPRESGAAEQPPAESGAAEQAPTKPNAAGQAPAKPNAAEQTPAKPDTPKQSAAASETASTTAPAASGATAHSPAQPAAPAPKAVLLFVGYIGKGGEQKHPEYTAADIAMLLDSQSGVGTKEFVITTANDRYNTSVAKPIVSAANIQNMPKSLTGERNDNMFTLIKEQYIVMLTGKRLSGEAYGGEDLAAGLGAAEYSVVTVPESRMGPISPALSLEGFVADSVSLAKKLIAADPSVKLWFSFPPMMFEALAECYVAPYKSAVVDGVKLKLTPAQWANNVTGFYFGTESAAEWYTNFDPGAGGQLHFANPVVKAMSDVSGYVRGMGKKMLWIPYYGHHYDGNRTADDERVGAIVNATNIFDYVVVQPSYYFNDAQRANIAHLAASLSAGALKNSRGSLVTGGKSSGTALGVEMELDARAASQSAFGGRYAEYVKAFSPYKHTVPVVFYAGDRDHLMHPAVLREIHSFFT